MKKVLITTLLFIIVATCSTMARATTCEELPSKIYSVGAKYGVTESHKLKMERFLAKYPATDEQCDQVMEKVNAVVKIFEEAGVTRLGDLPKAKLQEVQNLATEAANILNVKLVWKSDRVEIYYNGKAVNGSAVDVIYYNSSKLVYTGNEFNLVNVAFVVSSVASVALVAGFIQRKKFANA